MKKSNIALGITISFAALGIISCFFEISVQILTTLSICSFLITIAQTLQNFITIRDEEEQKKFDCVKQMNNFKFDEKWDYFYKKYWHFWNNDKKAKILKVVGNMLEVFSVMVLLLGLIVPLKIFEYEWVSNLFTFLSFSFLFFSIWLVGIIKDRINLWNELLAMAMLLKNPTSIDQKIETQDYEADTNLDSSKD